MDIQKALQETGAVVKGHFQLSSGRHSDTYFEKFRLLEHPRIVSALAVHLAAPFKDARPDVVAGPTLGGAMLAYEVARSLGVQARYLERVEGKRGLRRGAVIPEGARVLLVDDVMTTGLSIRECFDALEPGELVGVGVLVSRTRKVQDFPAPFHALLTIEAPSWEARSCPLCTAGEPLMEPGSRRL